MRRTESPNRYGRRAPRNVDRNLALPAAPAASTKGSTGRQHVAAARTLPTADSAAASPPREAGLPIVVIVWLFIRPSFRSSGAVTRNARVAPLQQKRGAYSDEDEWPNQNGINVNDAYV